MMPFYLKFNDKAAAETAFRACGFYITVQPLGEIIKTDAPEYSLNVIGDLYKDDVLLDGYHANLLCEGLPEALSPFVIEPTSPLVVWSGVEAQ